MMAQVRMNSWLWTRKCLLHKMPKLITVGHYGGIDSACRCFNSPIMTLPRDRTVRDEE